MELYGYQLPSISSLLRGHFKVQAVEYHLQHQKDVLQILKYNLVTSQNRTKQQEDQNHSERSFEEGDWVFLRLQTYKKYLKKLNKDNKLAPK